MGLAQLTEWLGDGAVSAIGGLVIGLAFGALAQQSKFCLRAATIELSQAVLGPKTAVWALTFSAAVACTQALIWLGWLDVSGARPLADRGSLSGAIIGGAMFGVGMILARGCASRLLVLSGTGNMRALFAGLLLTVIAQASLRGVLATPREFLAGLWTLDGGRGREMLASVGGGPGAGVLLGCIWLALGVWIARRNHLKWQYSLAAVGVGSTIAAGWAFTYAMSLASFEPVRLTSVSFTGPSADTLMGLINARTLPLSFDTGLVPGVFLGSMLSALATHQFELQGFDATTGVVRYAIGAPLMGFGGMLAGGCAVGAGISGGAIFALTGWLALASMWVAAVLANLLIEPLFGNGEGPARMSVLRAAAQATSLRPGRSDPGAS